MNKVPLTEKDVKKYLDNCIALWRKKRNANNSESKIAVFYIDAFQSVRMSLFGELL